MIKRVCLAFIIAVSLFAFLHKPLNTAKLRLSVVKLSDLGAANFGTGFVVQGASGATYIVTNHHVCNGAGEFMVIWKDEKPLGITKIALMDQQYDLCALELNPDAINMPPLSLSESDLSPVVAIGHPLAGVLTEMPLMGRRMKAGDGCFATLICGETSGYVQPGASGSPVFNSSGYVVGVIHATALPERIAEYIPLSGLVFFLSRL